jgi:murein DD-endopeptidase MepM/ murein hydrolase activator NlpD
MVHPSVPVKSSFTRSLLLNNSPVSAGFKRWAFHPGMLFCSGDQWWSTGQRRQRAHEGLDVRIYEDKEHRILNLVAGTKIPAAYGGTVAGIVSDFLGRTVVIEHPLLSSDSGIFCTIYGHLDVSDRLHPGQLLTEGEIIGATADTGDATGHAPSHLHLTVGWRPAGLPADGLHWGNINDPKAFALLDPLEIIDGDYLMVKTV